MLTQAEIDAISSGSYQAAYNFKFSLSGGEVLWTTLPYDYQGFQSENYIKSLSGLKFSDGLSKLTANIGIAGTLSMLSAFDNCISSKVEIQRAIFKDTPVFNTIFNGYISKYGVKRGASEVYISLDCTDRISNMESINARLLTPNDQRNFYLGDDCLKYMTTSTDAVFWGKEV